MAQAGARFWLSAIMLCYNITPWESRHETCCCLHRRDALRSRQFQRTADSVSLRRSQGACAKRREVRRGRWHFKGDLGPCSYRRGASADCPCAWASLGGHNSDETRPPSAHWALDLEH